MSENTSRLGEYRYTGNGQTLDNSKEYVAFDTDDCVEMFPDGEGEPIEVNRGNFSQMEGRTLERLEGGTPMA